MNMDTARFQAWARKGHWSNWQRKPERTEELRFLVVKALTAATRECTTTQLVDHILPGLDDIGRLYVSGGLQYLRKYGKVDGLWRHGNANQRTFGHPAIMWGPQGEGADGLAGLEGVL